MANWLWFTRAHCAVYRGTRGLVGGNLIGIHMLLLTTKGRKTGKKRTLPLAYVEEGGDYIVVASNGGAPHPPAWWLNLKAAQTAEVQVGSERFEVSWELAAPERRTEHWRLLQAAVPAYRRYRHRTDREIPIVRLKRHVTIDSKLPAGEAASPGWRQQALADAPTPAARATSGL